MQQISFFKFHIPAVPASIDAMFQEVLPSSNRGTVVSGIVAGLSYQNSLVWSSRVDAKDANFEECQSFYTYFFHL